MNEEIKQRTTSSSAFIFDEELIEEIKPYYALGIDTCDKTNLTYCLMRKTDDVIEILLSKTMRDKIKFEQEIETLASCFSADIFKKQ